MVGKTIGIVMIINGFDVNLTLSIITESKLLTAPKVSVVILQEKCQRNRK